MTLQASLPTSPQRRRFSIPSHAALLAPVLVFLLVFFVVPLVMMLSVSVLDKSGSLTTQYYRSLLSSGVFGNVLANTFRISIWTTAFTVLLAYPVAYYLARRPHNTTTSLLLIIVLLPFWTSVLVRSFAWMVILGREGALNSTLLSLGVSDAPVEMLYTFFSVIVSMVHALMPVAVMTMLSAMQNIDQRLELAASTLGAERGNIFWRIYFPLSFPGVASAILVTFIVAMGMFVQSALLGSRQETMIAQLIIQQIDEMFNWGMASAMAVLLLSVSIVVIIIFDKVLGVSTIAGSSGRGQHTGGASGVGRALAAGMGWLTVWTQRAIGRVLPRRPLKPGSHRRQWGLTIISLLIIAFLALPSFFLVPVSFTESNFLEWPPKGFSWKWYDAYFSSPVWREATIRSFVVALCVGTLSVAIGVPAALALTRFTFGMKRFVLPYILMPLIAPNIIVALALFYYFADLGLVGTSSGLVIGHTVFALPYVVVAMIATLRNYDQRLDQAAWTLGANQWTAFRMVTLPIIKVGFVTSFLFAFVRSFDELTVALFISSGLSTTLPKKMWSEAYFSVGPTLASVSTILLAMVTIIIVATELMNRRYSTASKL